MGGWARAQETLVGITMIGGRGGAYGLALDAAALATAGRVVDVGCGPGGGLRVAARRGVSAIGVDPSPAMLRLARWAVATGAGAAELREGRAEALPLEDSSAEAVVAVHSVHHWPDPARGFAEAHRVLVPGGRLVVVERLEKEGRRAHHAVTTEVVEGWRTEIETAGFAMPALMVHGDRIHRAVLVAVRDDGSPRPPTPAAEESS